MPHKEIRDDYNVAKLICTKCGVVMDDQEPGGMPEFHHKDNPKRYCPNDGKRLDPGMTGVAVFRRKRERRARKSGARRAFKITAQNKGK